MSAAALDRLQTCRADLVAAHGDALDAVALLAGARATRAVELADKIADAIAHCERLAFIVEGDVRNDQAPLLPGSLAAAMRRHPAGGAR